MTHDDKSALALRRRVRLHRNHSVSQARRSAAAASYVRGRQCFICESRRHCGHREPAIVQAEIERRLK
jgi:hypothetical protein